MRVYVNAFYAIYCIWENIGRIEYSDVVLSPLLLLISGIIYLPPLKYLHYLTPLNVTSKHTILPHHNFLTT